VKQETAYALGSGLDFGRVLVRPHPLLPSAPSAAVGLPTAQLSVAVSLPSAASISAALGLQPKVSVVPVAVISGAVVSAVQVTVRSEERRVGQDGWATFQARDCEW